MAEAHYTSMKKNLKKVVKSRCDVLFGEFLSGRTRTAESWLSAYMKNPVLRYIAEVVVWQQNEKRRNFEMATLFCKE